MKIILDCNIWISLLIGHQAQLIRHIEADSIITGDADLLDLKQHKQTQMIKLADFRKLLDN